MMLDTKDLSVLAYVFRKDRSKISKSILGALRNSKSISKLGEEDLKTLTSKIKMAIEKLQKLPTTKVNGSFIKSTINELQNILQKCKTVKTVE